MTEISRRRLLGGSLAAGAGMLAGVAKAAEMPQKWDATYDVIVVGSGFAGLAAAIEAKKAETNIF